MDIKFSPFTSSLRLFHAQSLLGMISLTLPFDMKYNDLRNALFDAAARIMECSDILSNLEDK